MHILKIRLSAMVLSERGVGHDSGPPGSFLFLWPWVGIIPNMLPLNPSLIPCTELKENGDLNHGAAWLVELCYVRSVHSSSVMWGQRWGTFRGCSQVSRSFYMAIIAGRFVFHVLHFAVGDRQTDVPCRV